MGRIETVIFDWAGTTVDYGCFAPVHAFAEAFAEFGLHPTMEEIRQPMGMLKIDHIRTMMEMPSLKGAWHTTHGRECTEEEIQKIYRTFEHRLLKSLEQFAAPKEHVLETVDQLRKAHIKIGSTTGYTKGMMDIVKPAAKRRGYMPDLCITPELVGGRGRPFPYMIFENMRLLGASSVKNVIKVGDTRADIQEGVHAGVWSVGVLEGSSQVGLSKMEFDALAPDETQHRMEEARTAFFDAGADFVLDTLQELPRLVDQLNWEP